MTMSHSTFKELCEACYVTREDIEAMYMQNPTEPWSVEDTYTEDDRKADAESFLDTVFGSEGELNLPQLSQRMEETRRRMMEKTLTSSIWGTIGNIQSAIARTAANAFREYMQILPDAPLLSLEQLRKEGKPSPYREDMQFPNFVEKPDGSVGFDGTTHSADEAAAGMMYAGDMLALLIAREYEFEDRMP